MGEVFASPLDLNVEQGEIEQPLKPMLRIAATFATAPSGCLTPLANSAAVKR